MPEIKNGCFKVNVKDGKSCERILSVEVTREAIDKEYDIFYKAIAPKAKISGFRPGKAPRKVLALHYGREAREEVLKRLIQDSYSWALKESKLDPITMPEVADVEFTEDELKYKASLDVRPKIKLSRVQGLSAKKEKVTVKDKDIEESLKRVQEANAAFKTIDDRPSRMGDYVVADYVCLVDGKEVDKRENDWLEIKEKEFLKGFSKQLVGLKPGEEKDVTVKFPSDSGREELRGKEGVFKVKVNELKSKTLPALDDELAKDAGEFKTLDELKNKIREDLEANRQAEVEQAWESELLKELVKHNKLDLPRRLVAKRAEYLLEQGKQQFLQSGAGEEEFEKNRERMVKELQPEAERQVHLAFLLDEISKQENIKAEEKDILNKVAQTAERFRRPPEEVQDYYRKNPEALENLVEQVRNEKTIQFVKDHAKQK